MTFGYNPYLAEWSPFHGAMYAVLEAVGKVVAIGGDYRKIRLTLQYFPKLGQDHKKWGKPVSALLGAYYAQKRLGIPAIGGRTACPELLKIWKFRLLIAFAVCPVKVNRVISQKFKNINQPVIMLTVPRDSAGVPDFTKAKVIYDKVHQYIQTGKSFC